jgi:putative membrane protein
MNSYNIIKIVHIAAMISWMVGLFYLPRLFVYHCQAVKDSKSDELFKIMEYKLMRIIMNPAMIITFISGFYLITLIGFAPWLHAKITLVLALAAFHGFLAKCRKDFSFNNNKKSEKFYRIINEIPTILMLLIVSLVVIKPF